MKHILQRTCVVCRAKKSKEKLFRFLVSGSASSPRDGSASSPRDGSASHSRGEGVVFDKSGRKGGRGFYVCSKECWEQGVRKKRKIKMNSDSRKGKYINLPKIGFEEIIKV